MFISFKLCYFHAGSWYLHYGDISHVYCNILATQCTIITKNPTSPVVRSIRDDVSQTGRNLALQNDIGVATAHRILTVNLIMERMCMTRWLFVIRNVFSFTMFILKNKKRCELRNMIFTLQYSLDQSVGLTFLIFRA